MAQIGVATVETEVDLDGLDSGFDAAEGETNSRLTNLGSVVSTALTGVVLAAVAVVVGAIVGIGAAAFDVSSQFQQATGLIQAQLGLTAEEAETLGGVIEEVYRNNFGDSIEDVGQAVSDTVRMLGELGVTAEDEIQGATEAAFALRDTFGIEVTESLGAVQTLMSEFGLTSTEAFDLITTGFQEIPQFAEDGLDTIGEYSNLFADAGFSAVDMFNIIDDGAAGGVLATDKVADAVKEMVIRFNEGADGVSEAFDVIGLNFEDISQAVADGDATWADYFDEIVGGLQGIEDPLLRSQAEVAIFGTMAEDLGAGFTDAFDTAGLAIEDMAGRTEGLNVQYDTFGSFVEGIWRRIELAIKPIGDLLLDIAMRAMPLVEAAFAWFETTLMPVITFIGEELINMFTGFIANLQDGMDPITAIIDAFLNWTQTGEGLSSEIYNVIITIWDMWMALQEFLAPIIDVVAGFVSWKDILIIVGGVIGGVLLSVIGSIIVVLAQVAAVVGVVVGAVAVLRNAWENDWGGIRTFLMNAWEGVILPAIESLVDWLEVTIPAALDTLADFWENTLLPAIEAVWDFVQDPLIPLFEALVELVEVTLTLALTVLQGAWENILLPALEEVWGFIQDNLVPIIEDLIEVIGPPILTAIEAAKGLLGEFAGGLDGVKGAIQGVIDFINQLIDKLNNIEIPDLLTPGSPTPFEMGLRGIISTMRQLNPELEMMNRHLDIGPVSLAGAGRTPNRPYGGGLADIASSVLGSGAADLVGAGGQGETNIYVDGYGGSAEELARALADMLDGRGRRVNQLVRTR